MRQRIGQRMGKGTQAAAYRARVGLSYPPGRRAEAGEVVSDLPQASVAWLLAEGWIEEEPPPQPLPVVAVATGEGDREKMR